ncbi:MAG: NnrU family protein [Alphaproteobacteria bacterium]|nr:NnrU family protein [Alphaproteobacteria bacterium]
MYLTAFLAGLAIFFIPHFYSTFRARGAGDIKARMGPGPYMGLYSLVTLAGFGLIVWGYGNLKPWIPIWDPPVWTRHVALTLMLPALILLVSAYVPAGYIKRAVKHPMLAAVKVWALAHLVANGDLASIILFGSFLLYAVIDRIAVKRRGDLGPVGVNPKLTGDVVAVLAGAAVYGAIAFYLHPILFGVAVVG